MEQEERCEKRKRKNFTLLAAKQGLCLVLFWGK